MKNYLSADKRLSTNLTEIVGPFQFGVSDVGGARSEGEAAAGCSDGLYFVRVIRFEGNRKENRESKKRALQPAWPLRKAVLKGGPTETQGQERKKERMGETKSHLGIREVFWIVIGAKSNRVNGSGVKRAKKP